jgi:predicted permease
MVGIAAPMIRDRPFMFGSAYFELQDYKPPFAAFTSWSGVSDCDITDLNPVRAECAGVEASFLPTFGVQPFLGRTFTPDEDKPNSPRVALVSYGLWRSRFGGNPDAVGKELSLNGQSVQIVGVLPRDFELPNLAHADLVVPQRLDEMAQRRASPGQVLTVFARLKPATTSAQTTEQIRPLFEKMIASAPPQFRKEVHLKVESLRELQVHDVRLALWILFGAVLAVLLLVTGNVASMLLARVAAREREMAIRAALGARRARLVRQMLTETVLLSFGGGALGCLFAHGLLRLFVVLAPKAIPRIEEAKLDFRVLMFTLAVSMVCSFVFSLPSAFVTPRSDLLATIRSTETPRHRFRGALVTSQIALSLVLLTGSVLLLKTLRNLESVPLGMSADHVLVGQIVLGVTPYSDPNRQTAFFDELESRLERLPGVSALAVSDTLPPAGERRTRPYSALEVEGQPRFENGTGGTIVWRAVTPAYFAVLRIPIIQGRGFQDEDRTSKDQVIVLSVSLARRLFAGRNPLGQNVRLFPGGPWCRVIGVVADVRNAGILEDSDPEYYLVRKHEPSFGLEGLMHPDAIRRAALILRSTLPSETIANLVRTEAASLDPRIPVLFETMHQRIGELTESARFNSLLLGMFAVLALVLAAVGLYGLLSSLVVERTHEIGVRAALGAESRQVLQLVMGRGLLLALIGVAIGVAAGLGLTRFLNGLLYGVRATSIMSYAFGSMVLVVVALLASYIPARRAMRVDPTVALRYE